MAILELPTSPGIATAQPRLIEFGMTMQPSTGAPAQFFDRPGTRFALDVTMPPMRAATALPFVSRLLRAKKEGLRLPWPLMGAGQGNPGSPQVDGTGATGTTLPLKGLTAGYPFLEGYWLTVIDAAGVRYMHNVAAAAVADGTGKATLTIYPPLRASLANNDTVLVQRPTIEGLVTGAIEWPLPTQRLVTLGFSIEEQA